MPPTGQQNDLPLWSVQVGLPNAASVITAHKADSRWKQDQPRWVLSRWRQKDPGGERVRKGLDGP